MSWYNPGSWTPGPYTVLRVWLAITLLAFGGCMTGGLALGTMAYADTQIPDSYERWKPEWTSVSNRVGGRMALHRWIDAESDIVCFALFDKDYGPQNWAPSVSCVRW